ncbi:LysR family transcriptional regulator [Allokutzneria sp. A3M-2-11 16]|uniref:LysR family transcriptional regulator n=1 Tax=Allokutzneria sp. A3M-2-11 16 TaxID=2962043 RepID=UPI0020B810DF|nr:LysR family transcriptional regulator [Allokutzneria sp. A3M-2-11 16]MCP3802243.1 LysR family transcriptional regulator [Allokutzneria sp. A3M-2-11 16]
MLRRDLRVEWFVSFLAVVDTGGFSAAAEVLHRSQSRVSTYVAALEREVGLPLFDRSTRPVRVTEAGQALAAHARAVLRELDLADAAMAAHRHGERGLVTIGSFPSPSAAFVPALIERISSASPGIEIVLVERSTLELDQAFAAGELDLYLRSTVPAPEPVPSGSRFLWSEPLVVAHPPEHPLAALPEPLSATAVAEYPVLVIGRKDTKECGVEASALFAAHGLDLTPVQAATQPQTLLAMVRAGLGVGVLNALAATICNTEGLSVRTLDTTEHRRRVAVYWDAERPMSPAARTVLAAVIAAKPPEGCDPAP